LTEGATKEQRKQDRVPTLLVVHYRLHGRDAFIERYAANVSRGGIFIVTEDVQPLGTELAFEIRTIEGVSAFHGKGIVRWVRGADQVKKLPPGMGIQFTELDADNKKTLESMLRTQQAVAASRYSGDSTAAVPALTPADAAVDQWLRSLRPVSENRSLARWIVVLAFVLAGIGAGWIARGFILSPDRPAPASPRPVAVEPAAAAAARLDPPIPAPERLEYDGGR
jgi:uncharacterized protein (TIGR02266 family)